MKNDKSKTTRKLELSGRAAAYIRVSTGDQGERYSPASQLKALRDKATRAGKTIPDEWIFSDAHTGKLSSRPAFNRLKTLVKTGAPDTVYIYDVSRFARKTMDALWLAAEFKRHGVGLDFYEMPYEDTAAGRLGFTQMAAVAEFLGEKIIEDSTRGRLEKLQSGKLDHGSAVDGYTYIDKRQKDGCRLEVNPERAKIWQDIFRWRGVDHMAFYAIAKRLNEAGIPSAGHKGQRQAGRWCPRVIAQSLARRTYIGEHVRAGITVPCPAIISRELFEACAEFKAQSRLANVGRPSNKYLLRGFVWCAKCQKRLITNPGSDRTRASYRCGNIEYKPFQRLCNASQVLCEALESTAWKEIWSTLTNPDVLIRLAQDYCDRCRNPQNTDIAKLERDRARIDAQIKEAQKMIHGLLISFDQGAAMIRADRARLEQIEAQLAAAGQRVLTMPPRQQIEAFCRELSTSPEPGANSDPKTAYDERRPILEGIRELRMTYLDRDLEISGWIPLKAANSTSCSGPGVEKNSDCTVHSNQNSFSAIPFVLKVRVA